MSTSSKDFWNNVYDFEEEAVGKVYAAAWTAVLTILMTIPIMWALNAYGYQGCNIVFMSIAAVLSPMWAFRPNHVLLAMAGGGFANKLMDKDGSQGTIAGLKTYSRVVAKVLFYYFWMCLILTFVSFEAHPKVFWYIVPVLMFAATMSTAFNLNTNKRTVMLGNITIIGAMIASLMVMASSPSGGTPSINNVVSTAYNKTTSNEPWFPAANSSKKAECPIRTCIFVNSSEWSKEIPVGEGIDWTRSFVQGTVLALRVDGNDDMTKLWDNGKAPRFKSGSYIQVRLVEGEGAMAYFDSPLRIAAFKKQK